MLKQMDPLKHMRECGKHEKRVSETDMLRICETCGRHFYVCDLCRKAKGIDAPLSICNKCAPALRTLKPYLDRKEHEIYELTMKLRKVDADVRNAEEMKRQSMYIKKQNEEIREQLRSSKTELLTARKSNEMSMKTYEQLIDELKPKQELTDDLKNMYTTQIFSDCTITCGNQKFPAHKCILAARSEPLRKLLTPTNDPKNKQNQKGAPVQNINNIELNDIDVEVMPFLMNYLYTGEIGNGINDKNVQSVMKAADKFNLTGLRGACLSFMENRINRTTVIPILIEAYELNHERLKSKCMKFIQAEQIDLVDSPQWNNFKVENPSLALSLYERYVKEQTENSLSLPPIKKNKNISESPNSNNILLTQMYKNQA